MRLTRTALQRPVTVLMLVLTLVVLGAVSLSRLKIEFVPAVEFPFIGVFIPYPNAVPSQIEREIAKPVEEILATLGDVDEIFSESDARGCFVGVTFEFGREVNVLRLEVKEKIDQIRSELPTDIQNIFLFTFNSNDIPIMEGRISARDRDLAHSYDLLERKIIKPIERIDGVGRVHVDGISPREVSIYLKLSAIKAHNVDVERLFGLLNASNVNLSVGKVTTGGLRYNMRTLGAFDSVEDIANLRISDGIRLSDVADVVEEEPAQTYYRRLNGESAIAFIVQKASGANTVDVSRAVNAELERIHKDPALSGIDVILFFDQAGSILESLNGLFWAGVVGSILAVFVLYFFLRHIRTTLIVSVAIPFSLVATCVFLYLTDRSLNLLTMMGLMLAIGMLVDNAIVVLESIYRHQLRGERGQGAALLGTREVGLAVTASTLTSVIVFAPIVLGGGDEIVVWLREVGVTISATLIFSLAISLTLVPLLSARLAAPRPGEPSRLIAAVQRSYLRVLHWTTIRHPRLTGWGLAPAFILLTIVVAGATGVKPEPDSDRGIRRDRLRVRMRFTDNVNLYRADEYTKRLENFLIPRSDSLGVANVYSFFEGNRGEVTLFFHDSPKEKKMRELRKWLRQNLPEMAGVDYDLGEEDAPDKGVRRVQVTLFGDDSDLLQVYSAEVKRRLELFPDLHDVRTNVETGQDEIQVVLRREQASRFGVTPATLSGILNLTFRGMPLRDLQTQDREVPVGIILEPEDRRNLENLQSMTVAVIEGQPVTMQQVAGFEFAKSPQTIFRDQQRTAVHVTGTYEGEEFDELIERVERSMAGLALPKGYSWSFGREFQQAEEQQYQMLVNMLLALCCVYFVMAALFESLLHPLIIMLCIPFALMGVVWTLALTSTPLNIMAMIGLVILIGVVVNNGIVLLDHINRFRRLGLSTQEAILEGGRERFRPILMTASTTALGLMPLALGDTAMANAQYYPMARALIGGLISSTVLTLVLLPTFYVLAERQLAWARNLWSRSSKLTFRRRAVARANPS